MHDAVRNTRVCYYYNPITIVRGEPKKKRFALRTQIGPFHSIQHRTKRTPIIHNQTPEDIILAELATFLTSLLNCCTVKKV